MNRIASAALCCILVFVGSMAPAFAEVEQIQSLEHDTSASSSNSLVHVSGNVYALAYAGSSSDGHIKTFTVTRSGITQIQSLEHDDSNGTHNSLVHLKDDIFVLMFRDSSASIKTFKITDKGAITELDETANAFFDPEGISIAKVTDSMVAVAYTGGANDGYIRTYSFNTTTGAATYIAQIEHNTSNATSHSLVHVTGEILALAYSDSSNDGRIVTLKVNPTTGAITILNSLEHDTSYASSNSLVRVSNSVVALAYRDSQGDGRIVTFQINTSDGRITELTTLEHDASSSSSHSLVHVSGDVYALAYTGTGTDGYLKLFQITADSIAQIQSLEHDTVQGAFNSLVHNNGNFVLAYTSEWAHGYIKLFLEPDSTPPVITAPRDITMETPTDAGIAINIGQATATDDKDTDPTITNDAPEIFPIGKTVVTWTATDNFDNSATDQQTITVKHAPPAAPRVITGTADGITYELTRTHSKTGDDTLTLTATPDNPSTVYFKCNHFTQNSSQWHNSTFSTQYTVEWTTDDTSYVKCYKQESDPIGFPIGDMELVFFETVYAPWTTTSGFDMINDVFGDDGLFGVPWAMLMVLAVAAIWTGRNAQVGVIATAAVIGVMGAMGLFELSAETWAMVVLLAAAGMFLGKKLL